MANRSIEKYIKELESVLEVRIHQDDDFNRGYQNGVNNALDAARTIMGDEVGEGAGAGVEPTENVQKQLGSAEQALKAIMEVIDVTMIDVVEGVRKENNALSRDHALNIISRIARDFK